MKQYRWAGKHDKKSGQKEVLAVYTPWVTSIRQLQLTVQTQGRGPIEISAKVQRALTGHQASCGIVSIFVHHTSASLILCENADPQVLRDLEAWLERAVPDGDPLFRHTAEGIDDMPAHVRSVLTASNISIPVVNGRLDLGTWQGLYLFEHRTAPHQRRITLTLIAE